MPTSKSQTSRVKTPSESRELNRGVDVQVISRAADILHAIGEHPEGLSLAGIAGIVDLSRSTVHRIVVALCRHDFLRASDSGYKLGPTLLHLANASLSNFQVTARPHLEELSRTLRETVDLSELTGQSITFVDQVIALRRLRAVSAAGLSFPLHCTAPGKAVLAALDDEAIDRLLPERLERFTPATLTDREALGRELQEVRRTGVAFDREEHTLGICAVGSALKAPNGSWYAVSVPLPAQRFFGQEGRLVDALMDCVSRMSL
jgi:DNA-binding IclR family transcriptional regulator